MMTSRSGSSMVTEIFVRHGLWVGRTEKENRHGYRPFENKDLRTLLQGLTWRDATPARLRYFRDGRSQRDVRRIIRHNVPPGVRWVYKTGIDSWRLFEGYPNAQFVFIKRHVDSVVRSNMEKSGNPDQKIRPIVEARYALMDALAKERGIPYVYTDDLISGDYTSLKSALEYCGLTFQPEIADAVIDPGKWKH